MAELENESAGMDRRTLIKRGAVVGGTLVWATPVVQSLAKPAFAAGSAPCTARVIVVVIPGVFCLDIGSTSLAPACCACLQSSPPAACTVPCATPGTFTPGTPTPANCP